MTQRGKTTWLRLALSPLAWPFVLLYAFVVRLKNAAFDFHLLKSRQLRWPVVSVGNISVGGSGKTPMVMLLTRLLEENGWFVNVLSRGYGRNQHGAMRVTAQQHWRVAGDEPALMTRRGIQVYVGANRHEAGALAEQDTTAVDHGAAPRIHLLDDGFQHRELARSVDIVLLRREYLEDEMLPLGRLREPLAALERADICVLRTEDADLAQRVLSLMRQADSARVWIVERKVVLPSLHEPPTAFAFCGVGDPEGFFDSLRGAHVDLLGTMAFRDHHIYAHKDIERIATRAHRFGAHCLITTEKDCIRLDAPLRSALEAKFSLIVAELQLALIDPDRCIETLKSLISERLQTAANGMR